MANGDDQHDQHKRCKARLVFSERRCRANAVLQGYCINHYKKHRGVWKDDGKEFKDKLHREQLYL